MSVPPVPGLLLNGDWIRPVRAYGGKVPLLTDIVLKAQHDLFPEFHVTRFGLPLGQHFEEQASVDLVLVSRDAPEWSLVFVEPSKNVDMESLVSRIQTVQGHTFESREARLLARMIDGMEIELALEVVVSSPQLLVVTDDPRHDLGSQLADAGVVCDVMIVEPFHIGEEYAIRVNGSAPQQTSPDVIASCVSHATIPSCLTVHWKDPSKAPFDGPIVLRYGEGDTHWNLFVAGSEWQLQPQGGFPLWEPPPFEIVKTQDPPWLIRASAD